jgi:hypothetical protein
MTFPVEIVLKGRDFAVTESVVVAGGRPAEWTDASVREALVEILRAIGRAEDPASPRDREVILQGFSWIVEPHAEGSILAIEIPMGAAVAGPFNVAQEALDAMIARVLRAERQMRAPGTVH